MNYTPTIGLEIHLELNTQTKMFCACKNDPFNSQPNTNVCPICLGLPGAMPFPNKAAIEKTIMLGKALGSTIADESKFDRKHYFYPDLPKGYQISQYDQPLCTGGKLLGVSIRRIHLEEDTGKLLHDKKGYSLVDLNRAGVPLVELVTEPVIETGEQASAFAKELQLIVRYLGISEADMEKGMMRVEANVSIRAAEKPARFKKSQPGRLGSGKETVQLGTKIEVKNLNSFRSAERAIAFEIKRQTEILAAGETVKLETRGWDEHKEATVSQRIKETESDYRYFPEPDIPELPMTNFQLPTTKQPELPAEKRERLQSMGINASEVEVLIEDLERGKKFDRVLSLATLHATSLATLLVNSPELVAKSDGELIALVKLPAHQRKAVLGGGEAAEGVSDANLAIVVGRIIQENAKAVADYQAGKTAALQVLIGAVMRETKGGAIPQVVKASLEQRLA